VAKPINGNNSIEKIFLRMIQISSLVTNPSSNAFLLLYYQTLILNPSTVAKRLARHFTFGRSRVLTPVPPDQVWVFFRGFPTPSHRGMSHITDKAIAGSVSTSVVPTTFLPHPSTPYPSRIFPSMWLKRLWKVSAARPPSGGNERCILSFILKNSAKPTALPIGFHSNHSQNISDTNKNKLSNF
jgi:hypothetical protein